jgi:hypothetical protein
MMKLRKKRKVPYVPQLIQTECGFCCVAMLLNISLLHCKYEMTLN